MTTLTGYERTTLINGLDDDLAALAVWGDAAWTPFSRKLVRAAVAWHEDGVVSAQGNPSQKGRQRRHGEGEVYTALAAVAADWPGYPLGCTVAAVKMTVDRKIRERRGEAEKSADELRSPQHAANLDTLQRWVEDASADFLTCEPSRPMSGIVIRRKDGAPLDGPEADRIDDGQPITGVHFNVFVPSARTLTRRHRSIMTEVRDDVRHVLVRYVADDSRPDVAYSALSAFEQRNNLR